MDALRSIGFIKLLWRSAGKPADARAPHPQAAIINTRIAKATEKGAGHLHHKAAPPA